MTSAPIVIVADTGPLIALAKCGQLQLLTRVFAAVHLPRAVLAEATSDAGRPDAVAVREFVQAHAELHADRDDDFYQAVRKQLDEGEAQALSLARALGCGILIDERRGRAVASAHKLPLFGVLGVLLQAKRSGRLARVAPSVAMLLADGYRLSDALVAAVLHAAGESATG